MLVIDVETTGLDPKKHSIVSIGAVDFNNPKRTFYRECRPWKDAILDENALRTNGFSKEDLFDLRKKSLKDVMTDFLEWVSKSDEITFAGHNFGFDLSFIKATIEMYNLSFHVQSRFVDVHAACYLDHLKKGIKLPLRNKRTDITLDKALEYVGLPPEPMPHNALTGAKSAAEAFSRILYGKSFLDEFKQYPVPEYLKI